MAAPATISGGDAGVAGYVAARISTDGLNAALRQAASRGDLELVKALVERGANVNHVDDRGNTPLMLAGLAGRTLVANFLVTQGVRWIPLEQKRPTGREWRGKGSAFDLGFSERAPTRAERLAEQRAERRQKAEKRMERERLERLAAYSQNAYCVGCHRHLRPSNFSHRALRRPEGERKCMSCVSIVEQPFRVRSAVRVVRALLARRPHWLPVHLRRHVLGFAFGPFYEREVERADLESEKRRRQAEWDAVKDVPRGPPAPRLERDSSLVSVSSGSGMEDEEEFGSGPPPQPAPMLRRQLSSEARALFAAAMAHDEETWPSVVPGFEVVSARQAEEEDGGGGGGWAAAASRAGAAAPPPPSRAAVTTAPPPPPAPALARQPSAEDQAEDAAFWGAPQRAHRHRRGQQRHPRDERHDNPRRRNKGHTCNCETRYCKHVSGHGRRRTAQRSAEKHGVGLSRAPGGAAVPMRRFW